MAEHMLKLSESRASTHLNRHVQRNQTYQYTFNWLPLCFTGWSFKATSHVTF